MIFNLLIIHNHDRMSSTITRGRVLHTSTWKYFTLHLADRFSRSPRVVKEAIMTDINDLVQEFCQWRTSRDGVVGASFFEMRRLLEILQEFFDLEVCFDSIFATAVDLADKNLQTRMSAEWHYSAQSDLDNRIDAKYKMLFDGYRKMFDNSLIIIAELRRQNTLFTMSTV